MSTFAAIAVVLGGGLGVNELLSREDSSDVSGAADQYVPLPEPPESLRASLPAALHHLLDPHLVLLYRGSDGDFVAAVERPGVEIHSCPLPLDGERNDCGELSATVSTFDSTGREERTGGSGLSTPLPTIPADAEVLWQGIPRAGSIGIESPGACDRIERFIPKYACKDGELVETAPARHVRFAPGGKAHVPSGWNVLDAAEAKERLDLSFGATTLEQPEWASDGTMGAPRADDAFVLVQHVRPSRRPRAELPPKLDPDAFPLDESRFHDVPVRSIAGSSPFNDMGIQCYICFDVKVSYWIGPEASPTTWAQARFIIETLRVPND